MYIYIYKYICIYIYIFIHIYNILLSSSHAIAIWSYCSYFAHFIYFVNKCQPTLNTRIWLTQLKL